MFYMKNELKSHPQRMVGVPVQTHFLNPQAPTLQRRGSVSQACLIPVMSTYFFTNFYTKSVVTTDITQRVAVNKENIAVVKLLMCVRARTVITFNSFVMFFLYNNKIK